MRGASRGPRAPRAGQRGADALEAAGADAAGLDLPLNVLDRVLDEFGAGAVAEITGRSHRVVRRGRRFAYDSKPSSAAECAAFQRGEKRVAVISRAGNTGISLHAEGAGARPRLHVCVELPWSSEDFMQQCGRSHRSNEAHAPTYVLLSTDVPAERRFTRGLVHRLRGMGALTKGDRSACDAMFFAADDAWISAARGRRRCASSSCTRRRR